MDQDGERQPGTGQGDVVHRAAVELVGEVPEEAGLGAETNPELLPAREPFRSIMHWIGLLEQAIGAVLVVVILFLVLTQVAQRYIPGQGWPWTGEVARYSMVWATFLLCGYLLAHDRHISIHVVDYVLRGRGLAVVKILVDLTVLLTCLVMMYATWDMITKDIGQVTAAAQMPLKYVNVPVLIGLALSAVRASMSLAIADLPVLIHGEEGTS